jgi:TonB-linked SusC/RagA family outer membrane protein
LSDLSGVYNLSSAAIAGIPSSSYTKSTLLSGLGQIKYNYKDRYLFTASFRADGSSIYSEGEKWGYFPSVSAGWVMSNEKFINLNNTIFSKIKLRLSWGKAGSQAIAPYSTLNLLHSGKTVFGSSLITTMAPSRTLASPLKWETTESEDVGLNVGLAKGRAQFTVDYYNKKTYDLLNPVNLPASSGYTTTLRNVGSLRNRGFELSVNSITFRSKKITWSLSGNISFNRSKILKLYKGTLLHGSRLDMIIFNAWGSTYKVGQPRGVFYGYKESGYSKTGKILYTTPPGDKVKIGNPNPNFIFGINTSVSYKGFSLSLFLSGTQGNDIIDLSKIAFTIDNTNGTNKLADVVGNYWTPDHQDAKYPKPVYPDKNDYRFSNRYVEDGSYIRLRNIKLSYSVPRHILPNAMRYAKIYVSGQNLLTFTGYSWINPDVSTRGGTTSLSPGIDYSGYPAHKSVLWGIKLGF